MLAIRCCDRCTSSGIGTRLILNNLPALEDAELAAITSIGGSATITNNRAATDITMYS